MQAWISIAATFAATILGVLLAYKSKRNSEDEDYRRRAYGILVVLRQDLQKCTRDMEEYKKAKVVAPAYRLPTITWNKSATFLAEGRILSIDDIANVGRFFDLATQFNYCLDSAVGTQGVFQQSEFARALLKIRHALDPEAGLEPVATRARTALDLAIATLEHS